MSSYRYQEVCAQLKEFILNEKDFQKLPDERTLAQQFSVSRVTIRKALALLKEEKIIDVRHGSGIYINNNKMINSFEFGSLTQDMKTIGKEVGTELLNCYVMKTPAHGELSGFSGDNIICLERVRSVDGVKSIQELNYLCAERFPELDKKVESNQSLYQLLLQEYHVKFDRGVETLSAGFILLDTASKLDTSALSCAVKVIRAAYEGDRLVEYTISYTLAEHYSWQYELNNVTLLHR
ncbi:GntR family transcriptional regulator [Aeromonas tecta]|uniref:GntR family transcriptional regulator n=1 Tax=Aeromonas tecta TaxID=324617 RepID=UPI0018DE1774|nr:GntR family transcriptional regulator [Aeromonas tecta]